MRINKWLSAMGICSRREADHLIMDGKIKINGNPASLGQEISGEEEIELSGKCISGKGEKREKPKEVLLAYYKPRGIICTTGEKDRGKNVIEDIRYPERIYPIGRLDKDSEGLLLLTNQGELVNQINKSKSEKEKEYIVTVEEDITKHFLREMSEGVYLKELERTTKPCIVFQEENIPVAQRKRQFHIILTEGLNRQIRRMCETLGYRVKRLKRVRIMNLTVDGLKPGEYREIRKEDLGLE